MLVFHSKYDAIQINLKCYKNNQLNCTITHVMTLCKLNRHFALFLSSPPPLHRTRSTKMLKKFHHTFYKKQTDTNMPSENVRHWNRQYIIFNLHRLLITDAHLDIVIFVTRQSINTIILILLNSKKKFQPVKMITVFNTHRNYDKTITKWRPINEMNSTFQREFQKFIT